MMMSLLLLLVMGCLMFFRMMLLVCFFFGPPSFHLNLLFTFSFFLSAVTIARGEKDPVKASERLSRQAYGLLFSFPFSFLSFLQFFFFFFFFFFPFY